MSTINSSTNTVATHREPLSFMLQRLFAKYRITLSIICFATLIVFNLAIMGTRPNNPFALEWKSLLGVALVAIGVGTRSWSAGAIVKNNQLTTNGPYALVRNPLYVGSFLMMFGFSTLLNDLPTLLFVAGPLFILYRSRVKNEELYLHARYGEKWSEYTQTTPRFIPYKLNAGWRSGFSLAQWRSNREYQAMLCAFGAVIGIAALYYYGS